MFGRNGFERVLGFSLLSVLMAEAYASNAQSAESPLRATLSGAFHETVQEEVGVSGSVVVGVATANALSGAAALAGFVVPVSSSQVCLTVVSRDGVYSSRNTYLMPPLEKGGAELWAVLPFEGTQRRELINSYVEGDLAVRATPGNCSSQKSDYLVVRRDGQVDSVSILVNAFGANDVFFRTEEGKEENCQEFTEGRRTSYDFVCRVPVTGASHQQVAIERERYGRSLTTAHLNLVLSGADK